MQITTKKLSDTKVQLQLVADAALLQHAKQEVLEQLAKTVRVQGFRQGKVPLNLVEKHADPATLQTEFLDHAMNELYASALAQEKLRAVAQPEVKIQKFVPFETLELEVTVDVVGEMKLGDYKHIKVARKTATVSDDEIDEVLNNLRQRDAQREDVDRPVKSGDQVWIDFAGVDAKTKEPIQGADGKDYPLTIGSNTFIPGFEPELIGLSAGDTKTFEVTFPADYGVRDLRKRKVAFTVTVSKVQELHEAPLDDAFAAKVGPFKTLAELKADIRKQMQAEKDTQNERDFADELLGKVTKASSVAIPNVLISEQIDRIELDQKQNAMYRGQTWQEYLASEGTDETSFRERLRPEAEERVKAGLVLAEIAELERITISAEELEVRMQMLKGQYTDQQMLAELDKVESRRNIASRMMTEKTLSKLASYAESTSLSKSVGKSAQTSTAKSAAKAKPAKKPSTKSAPKTKQ